MLRYALLRLLWLPAILLVILGITTWLMRTAPGSPFAAERKVDAQIEAQIEKKWGTDKSGWKWFGEYLKGLARGDLGPSFKVQGRTVNDLLGAAIPVSLTLGLLALFLALLIGIPAGFLAGLRQNSVWDYGSMAIALVGISLPAFVIGAFLVMWLVFKWESLPVGGWGTVKQLMLPAITLSAPFAAVIARLARAGVLEVVHEDYVRTAKAKGLPKGEIVLKHLVRGAILPVISYLGPAAAAIFTGSFVVEKLFRIPGMGMHFVNSAINRDFSLILGVVIVYSTLLVCFNLLVDIAYGFLDPRVRLGK
ncbi:MAG: ABC transporter permease subunit [Planctomycetes bacterium]|nr:ABC transporter permease subunit [Planctomycetota bacterium]